MTNVSPDAVARARIAALRNTLDRLRAVVEPLTGEQLRQPGYPSEWTIGTVLSHLGSGAEITTLNFDAALTGQALPEQADRQAIWDRWNAKEPEAQAADALKYNTVLVEKMESLNADQRVSITFTSPWGTPVDASGFATFRLSEAAVHGWDVEVAVDPTATVAPDAVEILLADVATLVGFSGRPGPAARIHVVTSDPEREYTLVLGEKVSLEPGAGGESTGTLTLPAEAFLRLAYGRLDRDHTPPLTVTGIDLDTLRATFPGY